MKITETAESSRANRWLAAAALLLVVALRFLRLGAYPPIEADEGGWPLAVRQYVEEGLREGDYYQSPGYHWLLGGIFRLFGAQHSVSRWATALVALAGLWLFHKLAERLSRSAAVAGWATLLLGTSYLAVLIDRRAFMEPFVIAIMLALCLSVSVAASSQSAGRLAAVALLTALLILTKITGAFILPALCVWALWPEEREAAAGPRWKLIAAMVGGTVLAGGVFAAVYASDPANFIKAWTTSLKLANLPGVTEAKRFGFNPAAIERTIRWYAVYEPFQFGLAVAAFFQAMFSRRQIVMAGWFALGFAFLAAQLYVGSNHYAVVVPPICYLSAWLAEQLHAQAPKIRLPGGAGPLSWVRAAQVAMVLYSSARLAQGIAHGSQPEEAAVRWLAARADARQRVMAAPYVLMQLPAAAPVSFWRLGRPYQPSPEAVRAWKADWVVVDGREWEFHHRAASATGNLAALERALAACCELAYRTPAASVWRVKTAP